ncbi:MAG: hypothetical protein ACXQTZ_02290, partial [Candidatus Alkanophagales archaeon]
MGVLVSVPLSLLATLFLWGLVTTLGLLIFVLLIKRYAPEAFLFWKARRKGKPLCFVHFPEGVLRAYIPREEKGNPSALNYWYVGDVGIKFKGSRAVAERWNGRLPVFHYFVNIPEPVATAEAVAISQLKDLLKEKGHDVEGVEDLAYFVLSRYEKYLGKLKNEDEAMRQTLRDLGLDNEETVNRMVELLKTVEACRDEVEKERLRSGVFTYQTAVTALDSLSAYTSANVAHTKAVLESAIRENMASDVKDYIKYGIMIFLACLGLGVLFILTHSFKAM